ncbi:MAG TPA: prolyl oligopeptidase family serine peptidase [Bryobacteraceae bacterium]|nr:prolyl oligopeptidase family serine peptidase [Bryobacteraceae bacterium]
MRLFGNTRAAERGGSASPGPRKDAAACCALFRICIYPLCIAAVLCGALSLCAGDDLTEAVLRLEPRTPPDRDVTVANLDRRMHEMLSAIHHPATREQAEQMRSRLRSELNASLGFRRFPQPPHAKCRTVGTLVRSGYRIEKIVLETLPGVQAPALFYLPAVQTGKIPGILYFVGHWPLDSKTRPDFQAFCINMARLGIAVLIFDPPGQGERGISSRDHRRTELLRVGVSQQGLNEYETQCALEYLLSRPEIDTQRIGMTGASGGGYNTWMTAALDDRIKVVAPVVGTSEFYEQNHSRIGADWGPKDHCHKVPGLNRYANNQELVAMVAPRPLLIVAATGDEGFPITGVRQIAAYAHTLYGQFAEPERTAFYEDGTAGHGYQIHKREAAYGWFLRWLMHRGNGSPFPEPPTETEPYDSVDLRCFPVGQNQAAGPGIVRAAQQMAAATKTHFAPSRLEGLLGTLPADAPLHATLTGAHVERLIVPSEPDLNVPAFLLRPPGAARGVLLAVDDRGKEALLQDPLVQAAEGKGWIVCGVDPRGIGELATSRHGWVFAISILMGENFVWRQGWDLARTLESVTSDRSLRGKPVAFYGRGDDASLAVTYAMTQGAAKHRQAPAWFLLRDSFLSMRQWINRPQSQQVSYKLQQVAGKEEKFLDREIPAAYFVFDALSVFDFPNLWAFSGAKGLLVNPIDGDWQRVSAAEAQRLLPHGVRAARTDNLPAEASRLLGVLEN